MINRLRRLFRRQHPWIHVALVHTPEQSTLYINGEESMCANQQLPAAQAWTDGKYQNDLMRFRALT